MVEEVKAAVFQVEDDPRSSMHAPIQAQTLPEELGLSSKQLESVAAGELKEPNEKSKRDLLAAGEGDNS